MRVCAANDAHGIGSHLGLKLETISRLFSRFQEQGTLQVQGRLVKSLDPVALRGACIRPMTSYSKPKEIAACSDSRIRRRPSGSLQTRIAARADRVGLTVEQSKAGSESFLTITNYVGGSPSDLFAAALSWNSR